MEKAKIILLLDKRKEKEKEKRKHSIKRLLKYAEKLNW